MNAMQAGGRRLHGRERVDEHVDEDYLLHVGGGGVCARSPHEGVRRDTQRVRALRRGQGETTTDQTR